LTGALLLIHNKLKLNSMKIDKESTTQTHWKNLFDYKYLGSQDFTEGEDLILTIKTIFVDEVETERGKEFCCMCSFEEDFKDMIVNKTNFKSISKVFKTSIAEKFIGEKIQIFVKYNYKSFGKINDVLRIREFKPKITKPNLKKGEIENAVKNYVQFGNLDNVKEHRTISASQEKQIIELSKATTDEQ
jgi:hypothetical protein